MLGPHTVMMMEVLESRLRKKHEPWTVIDTHLLLCAVAGQPLPSSFLPLVAVSRTPCTQHILSREKEPEKGNQSPSIRACLHGPGDPTASVSHPVSRVFSSTAGLEGGVDCARRPISSPSPFNADARVPRRHRYVCLSRTYCEPTSPTSSMFSERTAGCSSVVLSVYVRDRRTVTYSTKSPG
jgi:hypothetical protein